MKFEEWYEKNEKEIFDNYFTLLRFPSVSAKSSHKKDMIATADWLENHLKKIGFTVSKWEGKGHPALFAEHKAGDHLPTLLFYGHYDVQPAEPFELWHSSPFEPEIRDGKVYARGAEDNKGQMFYTICAMEAFFEIYGKDKLNIKYLIEGEEEMGSSTLHEILPKYTKELKADHLLIVDMGMHSFEKPSLTIGARGLMTMEVTCRNAHIDMHSGAFGGICYNPIRALSEVLGKIFDEEGHIVIEGFYDDIKPLTEKEKAHVDLTFDPSAFKEEGILVFHKEKGYNPTEVNYLRPTFEINGIWGGYTGEGFKTVLPKEVHAKISCRLVPNQDNEKIYELVAKYIMANVPKGMHVSCKNLGGGFPVWANPLSSTTTIMKKAYERVFGSCQLIYGGGSIPITTLLAKSAGDPEISFPGTGLDSDCIHAPNENFSIKQFRSGFLLITNCLKLFAEKSHS